MHQTSSETIYDILLALACAFNIVEQIAQHVVLKLVQMIVTFFKPWNQVILIGHAIMSQDIVCMV